MRETQKKKTRAYTIIYSNQRVEFPVMPAERRGGGRRKKIDQSSTSSGHSSIIHGVVGLIYYFYIRTCVEKSDAAAVDDVVTVSTMDGYVAKRTILLSIVCWRIRKQRAHFLIIIIIATAAILPTASEASPSRAGFSKPLLHTHTSADK